jgi:hypothetical protein
VGQEAPGRHIPAVVHHGVEDIVLEPGSGIPDLVRPLLPPHLAHQIRVRVDAAYESPVVPPEAQRNHLGHIQAEPVYPVGELPVPVRIEPTLGDGKDHVPDLGEHVPFDRPVVLPGGPPDLLPLRKPRHS